MKSHSLNGICSILHHCRVLFRSYREVVVVGRIDVSVLVEYFVMKMRSGRASGVSADADAFSSLDLHSFCYSYRLKVGVSGLVSESVVDKYLITIAEQFKLHIDHDSVTCGIDSVSWLESKVHAGVMLGSSGERVGSVTEAA